MLLPALGWPEAQMITPFVTVVGLFSNVPQGGQLDDTQVTWLQSELTAAAEDSTVVLAMHHPQVSSDSFHGGSASWSGAPVLADSFTLDRATHSVGP
jgi:hypothetical protein